MAKKLKNLEITSVSFVDAGANQRADINLVKNKDGVAGEPKRSLGKRLLDFFTGSGIKQEDIEQTLDTVEKAGFSDQLALSRRMEGCSKSCDQVWKFTDALAISLANSIYNDELDPIARSTEMSDSLNEFSQMVKDAIGMWKDCTPYEKMTEDITKCYEGIKGEGELEAIAKARDELTSIINKSTGVVGKQAENKPKMQEGAQEEMKIDKSKMTEAEKAFLESIEKRYGTEDANTAAPSTGTDPETKPEGDVAKSAGTQTPAQNQNPEPAKPAEDNSDIYKGLSPELKAEFESLKKFKADAEDKELHDVAKRYEILGKKDEDLFPVLKSLKESSQDAYNQFVAGLDSAKDQVEKSGAFGEIGSTGTGMMASTAIAKSQAEGKIDTIAKSYVEKDPNMSYQKALAKAWEDHPELIAEYEQETNN